MTDTTKPTHLPPLDAVVSGASGASAPSLQGPPPATGGMAVANSGPTLVAPPSAVGADGGVTASTWRSGQVTATWSIDEVRNAWIQVAGVGWKKLYNGRDGAFTALAILAAQAHQTGRVIQFREEADGMVYEIYLW